MADTPKYYSKVAHERLAFDQASKLDRLKYTVAQAKNAPFYKHRSMACPSTRWSRCATFR